MLVAEISVKYPGYNWVRNCFNANCNCNSHQYNKHVANLLEAVICLGGYCSSIEYEGGLYKIYYEAE